MQKKQSLLPLAKKELYEQELSTIREKHFTHREIDVIACLIGARKTSKTASFLFIDPRTVESHIRNIMVKLNCNTREDIIDFVEYAGKLPALRKYYILLQIDFLFEKSLKEIAKLNHTENVRCLILAQKEHQSWSTLFETHLPLVGVSLTKMRQPKNSDYAIVVVSEEDDHVSFLQKAQRYPRKILCVFTDSKNPQQKLPEGIDGEHIEITSKTNYYMVFFLLLKTILPTLSIEPIIAAFKEKYETLFGMLEFGQNKPSIQLPRRSFMKQHRLLVGTAALILLLITGPTFFWWTKAQPRKEVFRTDLVVPRESILLERHELTQQMDEQLVHQTSEIKTLALVGVGGAGKTTLARQYAHAQKQYTLWEINAESRQSTYASYEKLAQILAKNESEQKKLRGILALRNFEEKENRLIHFVKERLKAESPWMLLYDNVEALAEIHPYFPHDPDTWGQGVVILTTRNSNIENNEHIHSIVPVGEMSPAQKLDLFIKIMNNGQNRVLPAPQMRQVHRFLESIPPFPLDISLAAYYLKTTHVSYRSYLAHLNRYHKDFSLIQTKLLQNAGDYTKTRYQIIAVSLQKLMEIRKDFSKLLLFTFLVDFRNLSRDMLDHVNNDMAVSDFILHLKKYSLLTHTTPVSLCNTTFSIHRSTQAIGLSYLSEKLDLKKNHTWINEASEKLWAYIYHLVRHGDMVQMRTMVPHCEFFLQHKEFLDAHNAGLITGGLGILYYFLGDDRRAKALLETATATLDDSEDKKLNLAFFLGYLGNVVRDLGDYAQAKHLLNKSLAIYKQWPSQETLQQAYFLTYLGIIERYLGNYDTARSLFTQGLLLSQEHDAQNYVTWTQGQLGILEYERGNAQKAASILENSLAVFKKEHFQHPKHFDISWALEHLGAAYIQLAQYEKAQAALEQCIKNYVLDLPDQIGPTWVLKSLETVRPEQLTKQKTECQHLFSKLQFLYKTHFHESYIYLIWPLNKLGILYTKQGAYDKARLLFEQILYIYESNYGVGHLATASVLENLGSLYNQQANTLKAQFFFNKAFKVLQAYKHPRAQRLAQQPNP